MTKRNEALQFIKDNSRLIADFSLPKINRTLEHRIGNNGHSFVLLNMVEHGWELFFSDNTNKISTSIEHFCDHTGCQDFAEFITDKEQTEHDAYLAERLHDNGEPKGVDE